MKEYTCQKCGGFVGEPGKPYGYAGKWCSCAVPTPPVKIEGTSAQSFPPYQFCPHCGKPY